MGIQGTVDDWRMDLLEEIERNEADDLQIKKVIWLTARDKNVCPLCAVRDGKYFTLEEARKEIEGEFCKPLDEDDRCRCTFIVDDTCYE
jgi:hypothetical protein